MTVGPTKVCARCKRELPRTEFRVVNNGLGYLESTANCRPCQVEAIREYRHARKFCTGCRRYRPHDEFVISGRGVRCAKCRKTTRGLRRTESDARKKNALADYEYATTMLGMSSDEAITWIAGGNGVTTRAVERWLKQEEAA